MLQVQTSQLSYAPQCTIKKQPLHANEGAMLSRSHIHLSSMRNNQSCRFFIQVAGGRFKVHAVDERLEAQQWLLPGVQLLRLLQPVAPGGGHLDPVGTHRQRVGRVATQEGQTSEGEDGRWSGLKTMGGGNHGET